MATFVVLLQIQKNKPLKLTHYTIGDFKHLSFEKEFLPKNIVPITPERILSQIHNPDALDADIVLTVALNDQNEIIGYVGALPANAGGEHCAWNSCWWVKPGAAADVSMQLLYSFISNWKRKVLFSEMTPHTSKIIEHLGFCSMITYKGFRGYYRFCMTEILTRKKPAFKKISGLLRIADAVANSVINTWLLFKRLKTHEEVEQVNARDLTEEDRAFIALHSVDSITKRSIEGFNWISKYKWLVRPQEANPEIASKYYFSYSVKHFESQWLRFKSDKNLVGLVNYTIRDKEIKLSYVFCSPGSEEYIADYFYIMLKHKRNLSLITTFHPGIVKALNTKSFIFKTHLPKFSAVSNEVINAVGTNEVSIQMGDGDCVFT